MRNPASCCIDEAHKRSLDMFGARWMEAHLGVIRQILGHARLETTVRYGKPTQRDVRQAMEGQAAFGS